MYRKSYELVIEIVYKMIYNMILYIHACYNIFRKLLKMKKSIKKGDDSVPLLSYTDMERILVDDLVKMKGLYTPELFVPRLGVSSNLSVFIVGFPRYDDWYIMYMYV